MLRATELLLFLSPFIAAGAWWWLSRRTGFLLAPTPTVLVAALLVLTFMGGCLVWFGLDRRLGDTGVYVPAQLVGGQITPPHTAPR
jgi:hypothetical protein